MPNQTSFSDNDGGFCDVTPAPDDDLLPPVLRSSDVEESFQDEDLAFVCRTLPEAKEFLKERLALSIRQRKERLFVGEGRQDRHSRGDPVESTSDSENDCTEDSTGDSTGVSRETYAISTKLAEASRWKDKNHFPDEPILNDTKAQYSCQICSTNIPPEEATGDSWVQHVAQDLKPYICILENCTSPQTTFGTFEDWIAHMRGERGALSEGSDVSASCLLCSPETWVNPNTDWATEELKEVSIEMHIASHLQCLALAQLSEFIRIADLGLSSTPPTVELPKPRHPIPKHQPNHNHALPRDLSVRTSASSITISAPKVTHLKEPSGGAARFPAALNTARWGLSDSEVFDILVAEDNPINQEIIMKMLQEYGQRLVVANDGQEALMIVRQHKFDVILMGIQMPVLVSIFQCLSVEVKTLMSKQDGCMATLKIREHEQLHRLSRTPIIGIARCFVQDMQRKAIDHGMDGFITGDYNSTRMIETVQQFVQRGRLATNNPRGHAPAFDGEVYDILVAEDNVVSQRLITKMLQKFHQEVVMVENGQKALDAVKRRNYDIILMDVAMPVMAGLEATAKIREYESYFQIPRTPIVGMTAHQMLGDRETLLAGQMDGVIVKPLRYNNMVETVLYFGRLMATVTTNDTRRFLASLPGGPTNNIPREFGAKL